MTETFLPHPTVPRRVSVHLFELAVALVFTLTAISYLVDPSRTLLLSPVGQELPAYLWITWSGLEVLGGTATIYGLLRPRPNHRVAGLTLLTAGLTMHGIAAIAAGFEVRDLNYLIFAVTCALRATAAARFALERR